MILRNVEYKLCKREIENHQQWIPLPDISQNLILAILSAEDNNFLKHHGFDWKAMQRAKRAYFKKKKKGNPIGYSTISQQTSKNIFLFPSSTIFRKILELYFSLLIEKLWGKARIFEIYINFIEVGSGIYGVEAASKAYFNKSASDLTLDESVWLASTLTNPRDVFISNPSNFLQTRYDFIHSNISIVPDLTSYADQLQNYKFSNDTEMMQRTVRKLNFSLDKQKNKKHPYRVFMVLSALLAFLMGIVYGIQKSKNITLLKARSYKTKETL